MRCIAILILLCGTASGQVFRYDVTKWRTMPRVTIVKRPQVVQQPRPVVIQQPQVIRRVVPYTPTIRWTPTNWRPVSAPRFTQPAYCDPASST